MSFARLSVWIAGVKLQKFKISHKVSFVRQKIILFSVLTYQIIKHKAQYKRINVYYNVSHRCFNNLVTPSSQLPSFCICNLPERISILEDAFACRNVIDQTRFTKRSKKYSFLFIYFLVFVSPYFGSIAHLQTRCHLLDISSQLIHLLVDTHDRSTKDICHQTRCTRNRPDSQPVHCEKVVRDEGTWPLKRKTYFSL